MKIAAGQRSQRDEGTEEGELRRRWLNCGFTAGFTSIALASQACFAADVPSTETIPASILNASQAIDFTVVVPHDLLIEYGPQFTTEFQVYQGMFGIVGSLVGDALDRSERKRSIKKGQDLTRNLVDLNLDELALSAAQKAFKDAAWLRVVHLPTSRWVEGQDHDMHAAILFEFGVLPTFDRIFVGCSLILEKARSFSSEKDKLRKREDNIVYRADHQSTTEVIGLSGDQSSSRMKLTSDGGSRLKQLLALNADACASNAARRALLSDDQLKTLKMQRKVTVSTRRNQQFQGWLLDGSTNLTSAKFGALGSSKAFVATGTDGVLLLDAHFGLMRITARED